MDFNEAATKLAVENKALVDNILTNSETTLYFKVNLLTSLIKSKMPEFDLKCDYCNAEVKNITAIPDGWVRCRINTIASYTRGPSVCPEHARQLGNIFKEYADKK